MIYCEKIENISIDGTIVCERAKDGHIYYIGKDYKDDFSDNNCGYKVNEEKKMIDDNGNMVPVEYIIIGEGKVEMLCDVFFNLDLIDITDGNVDFVEGVDCEKMDNYWPCFDINLNINRISLK